jgi:hypothetical protein
MVVLLRGAHPAARKLLVETLLEGRSPGDPEAPCVRVCFSPHELLDAPLGARVVLVGAERAPEWLNVHRPVVWERELVLLLWVEDDALEPLRRNAPDFLDWISHRVEVPWFAPEGAVEELVRAHLSKTTWIAVAGAELVEVLAAHPRKINANQRYDELVSAMLAGDLLVRTLERDEDLWRLMIAHAEMQWRHRVVLADAGVLPPFVWVIDARLEDWEQSARRLESLGVEHARLVAALQRSPERARIARGLAIDHAHMDLLGRMARGERDETAVKLARELGLDDVADALELSNWSEGQITPERIERSFNGGFRESVALGRYAGKVLGDELRAMAVPAFLEQLDTIIVHLLEDDGRLLRAWDPAQEPSFDAYLRRMTRRLAAGDDSFETRNAAEAASLPAPSKARDR